ncbi:unnamed protein product [Effrenium voratum]|uniref:Non-canonical E2 ubiquitin-conjugating enzyme C-terminal domain-containing protein n=1 Tax=Effrenium voratum TaxID=2562239 RepID=A0AA36MWZ2_9DINO|nr:unnamed protein product [Effrenium voratum]
MAVDAPSPNAAEISKAIDQCDEGTLRHILQKVIRKVPECRRKIAEDMGLTAELYQVSEEERQKAIADQYSEMKTSTKNESSASDAVDFCERAKFVPMRLTYDERKYLRLIDATMHVSHYTDHMDTAMNANANTARKLASKGPEWVTSPEQLLVGHIRMFLDAGFQQDSEDDVISETIDSEDEVYLDGHLPSERGAAGAGSRKPKALQADSEESDCDDAEVERRRRLAGRTDILGLDGFALFCLIWVITTGVLFSLLYFTIFARDRNFFHPLVQRNRVGKFFHGGVAAVLEL